MVGGFSVWPAAAAGLPPTVELMMWTALTLAFIGVAGVLGWLASYLLTLPLRRRERARLFLSLIEMGLRRGKSAEQTLTTMSYQGVGVFGMGLHVAAQEFEAGATLSEALRQVPGLLPRRVVEMLAAGERAGDVQRVLGACRMTLGDAKSQVRGALHYLILIALGVSGIFFASGIVFPGIGAFIVPKLRAMWMDMGMEAPPLLEFAMGLSRNPAFYAVVWLIPLALGLGVLCYVAGPWMVRTLRLGGLASWLARALPWRWKRVKRDFSAMLGVLLDAGVPEPEAVTMAARSTGNTLLVRRAERTAKGLAAGMPLSEAVARLDASGEFRWRLTNAAHAGRGFSDALAGWHEALDARAFHQEQAAAQALTSVIVLFNGALIAAFAVGMFQALVGLTWAIAIW